jgi:hypothetical protein
VLLRLSSVGFSLVISGLLLGALATPAHAYLDPGTGSMILQLLLGGVAGVAVAGRFYWSKLLSLLGIRSSDKQISSSDDATASLNRKAD